MKALNCCAPLSAALLLAGCAGAAYVEPAPGPLDAFLTLETGDMDSSTRITYSAFHDAACTPREGDGPIVTVGLTAGPARTVRVISGATLFVRADRQIASANVARNCINLISFVPRADHHYRLTPVTDANLPCNVTLVDVQNEKPEPSLHSVQAGMSCLKQE